MSNKEEKGLPPKPKDAEAAVSSPKCGHIIAGETPAINRRLSITNANSPSVTYGDAERRFKATTYRMGGGDPFTSPAPVPGGGPDTLNPAAAPFRPAAGGFKLQQSFPSYFPNAPPALMRNPHADPVPVTGGPGPFQPFVIPPFNQTIGFGPLHQNTSYYPYTPYSGYGPVNQDTGHDDNVVVGPTVPPPHHAPPTTWLSYECQKRHFNPVFRVTRLENGRFKCDIILRGVVVEGGPMAFEDIQDAKNYTAAKARKVVQKWKSVDFPHTNPESVEGLQVTRKEGREEDEEEKGSQLGLGAAVDMTIPAQARAYVEGFRMGQIAALQGANGSCRERVAPPRKREKQPRHGRSKSRSRSRSRSRSPKRIRSDRPHSRRSRSVARKSKSRREKSLPRYYDGSRHNPAMPSTDRYRPNPPADIKKEDSYGRLKEDDFRYEG